MKSIEDMEVKIKQAMAEAFQMPLAKLPADPSPMNIPAWDSAAHIRLIIGLEEQFGVKIGDEEVAELISKEAIVKALQGLTQGRPA